MRAGRIEAYIHSDSVTANKGGALVSVTCLTDFGARTDSFVAFAARAARLAYAAGATGWDAVVEAFPQAEAERAALSASLREAVTVDRIEIIAL